MTQENKELLLKDLCARLPHGVKVLYDNWVKKLQYVDAIYNEVRLLDYITNYTVDIDDVKPYLFPLSSMTEKQMEELEELCDMYTPDDDYHPYAYMGIKVLYKHILDDNYTFNFKMDVIDWFNKNHFDYRGLIEKGLALDATGLNIY